MNRILLPGLVVTWKDADGLEHTGTVGRITGQEVSVVETIEPPGDDACASSIEHRIPAISLTVLPAR